MVKNPSGEAARERMLRSANRLDDLERENAELKARLEASGAGACLPIF